MINIDGYYIDNDLRKDRNDTALGRGGGLIVYVRNDVTVNSISEGNDFNQYCKFSVKLNAKCRPLFVTLIYRSPNATSENTLKLANLIEKSERNSLMIGDFNLPNLCLASMTSDAKGRPIADATSIRFLENLVDFPTHVRGNTLDLALADEECRQNIFNVENIGNLSNSDHAIIKIELIVSPAFNGTKEKIHDWKKGDQEGLKSHLENVNFQSEFQNKDVTTAWATFRALIEDSINRYIPLVERRKKGDPKWMTRAVKNLVNRKQKAWRRFSKNRSDQNFEKYKLAEKQCKKGVSYAKRKFERNIAASGNKRPFSSYVRSKTKSRANVGPLKVNGKVISENKEMSSILNEYFTSVYSKESAGPVPEAVALPSLTRISNIVFSVNQVKKKVAYIKIRLGSWAGQDHSKIPQGLCGVDSPSTYTPLQHVHGRGGGARGLEEGKCDACVQERDQRRPWKLPPCLPHIRPLPRDGVLHPRRAGEPPGIQFPYQQVPTRFYEKQIVHDEPPRVLGEGHDGDGQRQRHGHCLSRLQ